MTKRTRYVVCAAINYNGLIICGARHHDKVMNTVIRALPDLDKTTRIQGFIDQFGIFMDRKEAMQVAIDGGQHIDMERNGGSRDDVLYSEGLY